MEKSARYWIQPNVAVAWFVNSTCPLTAPPLPSYLQPVCLIRSLHPAGKELVAETAEPVASELRDL